MTDKFLQRFTKSKENKSKCDFLRRSLPDDCVVLQCSDSFIIKIDKGEFIIPSSHSPEIITEIVLSNKSQYQQLLNNLVTYSPFDPKYDIFNNIRSELLSI